MQHVDPLHALGPVSPYQRGYRPETVYWGDCGWLLLDAWGSELPGPSDVVPGLFGARCGGWSSSLLVEYDRLLGYGLALQAPPSAAPRIRGVAPVDETGCSLTVEERPLHWGHRLRKIDIDAINESMERGQFETPKSAFFTYPGVRWRSTFSGWLRVARHGPLQRPPESLPEELSELWPVERWPFSRLFDLGFQNGKLKRSLDVTDPMLAWEQRQWDRIERLVAQGNIYDGLHATPELFPLLHECREDLFWASAEAEPIPLMTGGESSDA